MYEYTSDTIARILARDIQERRTPMENEICTQEIISVPNDQRYGVEGHIPCDHILEILYMDGSFKHAKTVKQSNYSLQWVNGPFPRAVN
jgi:hypothetical protein